MTTSAQVLPISPLQTNSLERAKHQMYYQDKDFHTLLQPETPLEAMLLGTPEFQEGLDWGTPRFGHPEGKVGYHVREVLDNVDRQKVDANTRLRLRLVALSHDTFKCQEFQQGKRLKHHGLLAREFMEKIVDDPALLDVIELHDEAFYAWRHAKLEQNPEKALERLEKLWERIGDHLDFYHFFYRCDTQTGDKIQAPLLWFESIIEGFDGTV